METSHRWSHQNKRSGQFHDSANRATLIHRRSSNDSVQSRVNIQSAERVNIQSAPTPAVIEVAAPPCKMLHLSAAPRDIEKIVRLVASGHSAVAAATRSGTNLGEVKHVMEQCERFSAITGIEIGMDLTLSPPRRVRAAANVWSLLDKFDPAAERVANAWILVASRIPLTSGWAVATKPDAEDAAVLLAGLGYEYDETRRGRLIVLKNIRQKGLAAIGIWNTLAWVLMVSWVCSNLRRSPSAPLMDSEIVNDRHSSIAAQKV